MPWQAWAVLGVLLAAFLASVVLNTVVVLALTSRQHAAGLEQQHTHAELCRLYVILHRDDLVTVLPPTC